MKTVVVASTNPVKLHAARTGFERMFPGEIFDFRAVSAPSGVSDQPFSNQETLQGALNRAHTAQLLEPDADFWVGIEGGVEEDFSPCLPIKEDCEEQAQPLHPKLAAVPAVASQPLIANQHQLVAFAWVAVLSAQRDGRPALTGKGRTGAFFLPPRVAELVRAGKELGEADDIVFGRSNSKQENGAVGLLTGDVIDRAGFYEQAVILSLIPFRNIALYS